MKYKRDSYLKIDDLISLDNFAANRSFDSWTDVFYDSLVGVRSNEANHRLSYEQLARRYPKKIIKIFLELLCEDLIYNDVHYVMTPKLKGSDRVVMRIAMHHPKTLFREKHSKQYKSYYSCGGVKYQLRVDNIGRRYKKAYLIGFYRERRNQVKKQLASGKRYFNSYKEKIYSQL